MSHLEDSHANYKRGLVERLFHALLFEALAIGISTPVAAWLTGQSLVSMGLLTAVIATMAMLWNMVYNWFFDKAQKRYKFDRTLRVRAIHAVVFELVLIITTIPVIAWWLNTTLWHALLLDIGLVLFYLPYAFCFNLGYDKLRQKIIADTAARKPSG
jgi:uncharacterized membrane protein